MVYYTEPLIKQNGKVANFQLQRKPYFKWIAHKFYINNYFKHWYKKTKDRCQS